MRTVSNTRSGLDTSYRAACLAIILLLGLIWWVGFVDVCNAFWRALERLL